MAFFARAERFFDTTFPSLFFVRPSLVRPLAVFCLRPEKTADLAREPLAMTLTFLAFMVLFMPADFFMAAAFFMAAFITAFFIGRAMATSVGGGTGSGSKLSDSKLLEPKWLRSPLH